MPKASSIKLEIAEATAFVYPDLMVLCGELDLPEGTSDAITSPMLVIEVLSGCRSSHHFAQQAPAAFPSALNLSRAKNPPNRQNLCGSPFLPLLRSGPLKPAGRIQLFLSDGFKGFSVVLP